METIFNLLNLLVMPFWFLMIGLPKWQWTQRIIGSHWIALPVAVIYAGLLLSSLSNGEMLDLSLSGIATGLSTLEGATIGWAHFLAFDLLVGRWIYLDSRKHNRSPWLMAPVLLFVFMAGPLGYLLYLVVGLRSRKL